MDTIVARLNEIASLVTRAAEAETLEEVLERIAQVSRELVQARYAALGVPDGKSGLRYFKVAGISPEQIRHIGHLPQGRGLLGALIKERQPIRIDRMQDDPRSAGFCNGHPEMTSLLGVPIHMGDELYGLLYLCDRMDGQPFSDQDQWLIEMIASYAALAIAGTHMREQYSRLATLEERERISMELHDGIIQSLYAIGMQVDLMRTAAEGRQTAEFQQVIQELNLTIEDIRSYIQNLKAASYNQKTIRECFGELLSRMHIPDKLAVEIVAPDVRAPFPPHTFEALCQITHEAISNAIRHADANHLRVVVTYRDDVVEVQISDDGRGFDASASHNHNGLGLRNIQQRARLHGGRVDILTTSGQGTQLTVTIPVKPS
jgi:signal transduction histidine kinase